MIWAELVAQDKLQTSVGEPCLQKRTLAITATAALRTAWYPAAPFEASVLVQVAFGVALEYYLGLGPEAVWTRIQELSSLMRMRLAAVPGVTVHDAGRRLCGIVAFSKVCACPVGLLVYSLGQCWIARGAACL